MPKATRRQFIGATATSAAALALTRRSLAEDPFAAVRAEVEKQHAEGVKRLQDWIRLPSIAAENRSMNEGCARMMELARDAGFQAVKRIDTDGHPSVFATLDSGARRSVGVYMMLDVKQADPAEWSSPPFEAAMRPSRHDSV
jgi:acetylornithine deacetylase/succinyl-diaminopimelate desuccinylase-like protein